VSWHAQSWHLTKWLARWTNFGFPTSKVGDLTKDIMVRYKVLTKLTLLRSTVLSKLLNGAEATISLLQMSNLMTRSATQCTTDVISYFQLTVYPVLNPLQLPLIVCFLTGMTLSAPRSRKISKLSLLPMETPSVLLWSLSVAWAAWRSSVTISLQAFPSSTNLTKTSMRLQRCLNSLLTKMNSQHVWRLLQIRQSHQKEIEKKKNLYTRVWNWIIKIFLRLNKLDRSNNTVSLIEYTLILDFLFLLNYLTHRFET